MSIHVGDDFFLLRLVNSFAILIKDFLDQSSDLIDERVTYIVTAHQFDSSHYQFFLKDTSLVNACIFIDVIRNIATGAPDDT